jgi:hypothetical protein
MSNTEFLKFSFFKWASPLASISVHPKLNLGVDECYNIASIIKILLLIFLKKPEKIFLVE